jgi:hypothetical protein
MDLKSSKKVSIAILLELAFATPTSPIAVNATKIN